jgi:phytol kinase
MVLGFALVFGILGLAEGARRVAGLGQETTRKFVHVSVGHWILLASSIRDWRLAVVAPSVFVVLNYLSHKRGTFAGLEREGTDTLGTVYYSMSLLLVILLLWGEGQPRWVAVAWGDGLAAVVGQRWGRRKYRGPGGNKSIEGSTTMLVASWVVVISCQYWATGEIYAGIALAAAVVATAVEAISPRGLDNLTVPFATIAVLMVGLP